MSRNAPRPLIRDAAPGIYKGVTSKSEIIADLGKRREVERLVELITGRKISDALASDLSQTVYTYLLEFPEDKLLALYQAGELVAFAYRIVWNQWNGSRSTFRTQLRGFALRSVPLEDFKTRAR